MRQQSTQGVWTTTLLVDRSHPFFFDHPVDHLPGILQVAGLLELAIKATDGRPLQPGRRVELSLDFPAFGELDEPVELRCTRDGADWRLVATQRERTACHGTLGLPPGLAIEPVPGASPVVAERAAPDLVHRVAAHTVMAGAVIRRSDDVFESAVLRSAALVPAAPVRHPIEVIEAARQLSLMLGHVAYGHPHDSKVLWLNLHTDLPAALPSALPLVLRWRAPRAARVRMRTDYRFDLAVADRVVGSVGLCMHTLSRSAYQKLRCGV